METCWWIGCFARAKYVVASDDGPIRQTCGRHLGLAVDDVSRDDDPECEWIKVGGYP